MPDVLTYIFAACCRAADVRDIIRDKESGTCSASDIAGEFLFIARTVAAKCAYALNINEAPYEGWLTGGGRGCRGVCVALVVPQLAFSIP